MSIRIIVFFVAVGLFFAAPKTLAGSYGVSVSCVTSSPGPCNTNIATIDMTGVVSVTYDSDNFDDYGYAMVTGPSGATQQHNSSFCCFGHIPTGNVTSWFQFDGVGVYKIYLHAIDAYCCSVGAWANLTVTTTPPTCTLSSPDSTVWKGGTVTLNWTTTNATSATINGINVPSLASGSMTSPQINSPSAFTMNVSGPGGTGTCGPVSVGLNTPPTGGLVPCGRLDKGNDPNIDMTKPCDLCAAFYMLKNIINFAAELAVGIAIFVIVIAGLLYVFSAGEPAKIELAKSAITYALTGLALIFAAWLVIAIILQSLGYADINTWNQVNCNLQK